MLKIALIGVCSVLMAINVKSLKSEYGLYIAFVACLVIGGYGQRSDFGHSRFR